MTTRKRQSGGTRPKQGARPAPELAGKASAGGGSGGDADKYRFLIEATNTAYVILDDRGRVLDANAEYLRLTGRASAEEILGRPVTEWTAPHDLERNATEVARCLSAGSVRNLVVEYVRPSGATVPVEINATVLPGPSPRIFTVCRDITERRRAEEALRVKTSAIEASLNAIALADPAGSLTYVNRQFLKLWGYEREQEVLGRPAVGFWEEAGAADDVVRALSSTGWWSGELTARRRDRSTFPVRLSASIVKDDGGRPIALMASFIDITDQKRAERAIAERGTLLQQIMDTASVAIFLVDNAGRITYANKRMAEMFRCAPEELVGSEYVAHVHPSERETGRQRMLALLASEVESVDLERLYWRKDGTEFWGHLAGRRFHDARGAEIGLIGVITDIDTRKRAEEKLRESAAKFLRLYNETPVMLHSIDRDGVLVDVNDHWLKVMGYERHEVVGRKVTEFYTPASRRYAEEVVQPAFFRDGSVRDVPYQFVRKDGAVIDVLLSATGERDAQGRVVRSQAVIQDLTERKALEEERLKAQKLASVGILAGGIAHDFNNLLQGVFGYTSLIRLTLDDREKALEMLDRAERALHEAVNLTNQLLTFSRGGKPVKTAIALRPVVENAAALALSGSRVRFELQAAEDLWPVKADEGQVGQVVRNIVLNAEQAMPLGGTVEISLRNVPRAAAPESGGAQGRSEVEIRIADHGTGIPPEHLSMIFDPYFTTKEKGSGLGLATAYSIVKNHDGSIAVESVLGRGTTFTVRLPATDAAPEAAAGPRERRGASTGRLLVMDDEKLVRDVVRELLRQLGHEAEAVADGAEALTRYRAALEAGRPFDAVILDLTIRAGMGGLETLEALRRIDPQVRAIVSSGYSENLGEADVEQLGFRAFLKKPYAVKDLVEVLDRVLAP